MNEEVYYTDKGRGDTTLLFLHYFGGSSQTWKEVIELLKDSFRCIAVDLPGFGASSPVDGEALIENTVREVQDFLQKRALKNIVLVGHSMGGKIALALAANKPDGLQQLVLIAPSPPTPEPMKEKKQTELLEAFGNREALEGLAKSLTARPLNAVRLQEIVDDNLRVRYPAWEGWIKKGSQENISSEMKNIAIPVTIISGAKDPNFSTSFLKKEFSPLFPAARFIELPDAGHLLPVEVPGEIAAAVEGSIRQHE